MCAVSPTRSEVRRGTHPTTTESVKIGQRGPRGIEENRDQEPGLVMKKVDNNKNYEVNKFTDYEHMPYFQFYMYLSQREGVGHRGEQGETTAVDNGCVVKDVHTDPRDPPGREERRATSVDEPRSGVSVTRDYST